MASGFWHFLPIAKSRLPIAQSQDVANADARPLFCAIPLLFESGWEETADKITPTVRPPRLGGNTRLGVFATRSPFRPNPIGLSCVRLDSIELNTPQGPILHVSGADLMDGTPIYDIKPYIPYTDCQPDATAGFTGTVSMHKLNMTIPPEIESKIKPGTLKALRGILAEDPRPRYQDDPERIYGFDFDGYSVKFKVPDPDTLIVTEIKRIR